MTDQTWPKMLRSWQKWQTLIHGRKRWTPHQLSVHMGFGEGLLKKRAERLPLMCMLLLQRSHYLALELGAHFLPGLLVFGHSGPLALLPAWTRAFMGPGRCQAHQGLRPSIDGIPVLKAGFHAGIWAPLGYSLWDSMQGMQFLDHYRELGAVHPRS